MPKRKHPISTDWLEFEVRLRLALTKMVNGQFLVLTDSQSGRFVQFSHQGGFGFRAEVSSNHVLPISSHLSRAHIARLVADGWLAPTGNLAASTPDADPDGSPNFYQQLSKKTSAKKIAALAVGALAEILDVAHPFFLRYIAFGDEGALVFDLGIAREFRFEAVDYKALMKKLAAVLQEITGLQFEENAEHLNILVGDVVFSTSLEVTPVSVHCFARLRFGMTETLSLHRKINELNETLTGVKFYLSDELLCASYYVPIAEFSAENLAQSWIYFRDACLMVEELMAAQFGGLSLPQLKRFKRGAYFEAVAKDPRLH